MSLSADMTPSGQLHKDTLLTAFRAMLLDDPETVTNKHLELLLRQFSAEQIISSAREILQKEENADLIVERIRASLPYSTQP